MARWTHSLAIALASVSTTATALAQGSDVGGLFPRLAAWSSRFEDLLSRATFAAKVHVDSLDGDGRIDERRDAMLRVDQRGGFAHVDVESYSEDGENKLSEGRAEFAKEERKRRRKGRDPSTEVHLPFLSTEQPKYLFRLGTVDPRATSHILIHFQARMSRPNLGNGSAWVDIPSGAVLSMSVAPSELAPFTDYAYFFLDFSDPIGPKPSPSRIRFESAGGFVFFRKHLRGSIHVSDYQVR